MPARVRHLVSTALGLVLALVLLAPMLRFARGLSFRESGLFTYDNLSTDLVLASLGVGLAMLWEFNVWLTPFALAPLVLVLTAGLTLPAKAGTLLDERFDYVDGNLAISPNVT